ncbi:radical SAM protein [Rhodococcus sp. 1168]|uniref:B12-binding domain-containing radical SAM protein n=1 Tax=Rhodococcus sp. 1168 TaxID=2018041 RepID=UPI000A0C1906|nr:radical SAM protein [Rhodococcus sp. 1168]ORI13546.1 hypothetical protein BJI47_23275 [Rhodococcus sp. 1168]
MIQLVFPGVTEARLFPYLSLPMLTSYLQKHQVSVRQDDLNIMLSQRLLAPEVLKQLQHRHAEGSFTRSLPDFGIDHHQDLIESVIEKNLNAIPFDVGFRIVTTLINTALKDSVLIRPCNSLAEVLRAAHDERNETDVALSEYTDLTHRTVVLNDTRIVGISVAFFSQLVPALRLAKQIRDADPTRSIILGGQQMMMRGRELASLPAIYNFVDGIATGQGEPVLLAMAVQVMNGNTRPHEVAGVITSMGLERGPAPRHHISQNPAPSFAGLPFENYFAPVPQLPLITCVGCYWGRCTFCSYGNRGQGSNYQQITHTDLAEVIRNALRETSSRFVAFVDENCNLRLIVKAVQIVRDDGYDFTWSTRNRLEPMLADRAFTDLMAALGCRLMSVGYETNVQRLLDEIDKGVDASLYETIVDNLDQSGIALRLSIMGGLPGETEEEAVQSRQFLVDIADRIGIDAAQMMIAEPTSLMFEHHTSSDYLTVDRGDELQSNSDFSYLGGRHGHVIDYEGADREERSNWLTETIRVVAPGKNDEKHPRWKKRGSVAERSALQLHPWIVVHDSILMDLRWQLRYNIALDHVNIIDRGNRTVLEARTGKGRSLLAMMEDADVGTS